MWLLGQGSSLQAYHMWEKLDTCFGLWHCPVNFYMTSQSCCRPTYFVKKDTSYLYFATEGPVYTEPDIALVIKSHITTKSGFGQIDPSKDVANIFMLKSVRIRGQGPLPKSSFLHTYIHTYVWYNGYRRKKMDAARRVQILDKAVCLSYSANTFGKGINLIILPPAMDK